MDLKQRIELVLSDILSDKYDCKVVLRFERRQENEGDKEKDTFRATRCAAVCGPGDIGNAAAG